jgi:3-keto-L-gulonate-6-phosphate decarboxylase
MSEISEIRRKIKNSTLVELKKIIDTCEANIEDAKDRLAEIRSVQKVSARNTYKKSIRQINRNLRNWENLLDDAMKEYWNRKL